MKVKSNAERLLVFGPDLLLQPGLNDMADSDWSVVSSHPHVKAMLDSKLLEVVVDAPVAAAEVEDKPKKKK